MVTSVEAAVKSLRQISTEPPEWLLPKQELSQAVRATSKLLFSTLKPHCTKSPFDELLIEGFDAEQIWQQIDLQSLPLLSSLRREVKKFEKHPEEISKLKVDAEGGKKKVLEEIETDNVVFNDEDVEDDDIDTEEEEEEEEEEEDGEEKERGSEEESENEGDENGGIEDKFLKIKELQEYLEEDEAREFGLDKKKQKTETKKGEEDTEDEDDEEGEDGTDEAEEEEDELGLFGGDDESDEDDLGNARYEDFFSRKKSKASGDKAKHRDMLEEDSGSDDEQHADTEVKNQRKDSLSNHEKELDKLRSKIEQMEKANLDPKVWTMRGEVTAAQRQKNSALEVDLDFEHNVRPAPVITEEVTASLEDLIKTRISEGLFDDVQKAPTLSSKAPREVKELDENKSKKGLAEIYEQEFVQKTDPASAPLTFSDELKKEASMLFKKLCLKLDALSHFHFTPKPVVEDMSIQTNVPALAMEEIAPMAVSDAAMLAPEEIFSGKGDIKEEAEMTKADRKRRRANKKRKFKAKAAKRPRDNTSVRNSDEGREV
ncbi:hypothetical protein V6N13_046423 [Hibiscus sabdariffa]|uniref:U3 small nucleolar ribonucleoprotein protein MPP10 n=1 Tax=Hibiscus sabdariffa TaxID=183260 RepID=A0ABR2NYV2_9ROSI